MARASRSFTEESGLKNSHLAYTSHCVGLSFLLIFTTGAAHGDQKDALISRMLEGSPGVRRVRAGTLVAGTHCCRWSV
eukprot:scaffold10955_cov125-Isochrysis_galbana.AAC.5